MNETGRQSSEGAVRADLRDTTEFEGYAIIPDAIETEKLVGVAADFARANDKRSRAGIRHAMSFASVAKITRDPKILRIAAQILSGDAVPFRATLFDKSPKSNWLIVWHQDTALPLKWRHDLLGWGAWSIKDGVNYAHAPAEILSQIIALRIHLDDSTLENGPLRVLPGTHRLGLLTDDRFSRSRANRTRSVAQWRWEGSWQCGRFCCTLLRNLTRVFQGAFCMWNMRGRSSWTATWNWPCARHLKVKDTDGETPAGDAGKGTVARAVVS